MRIVLFSRRSLRRLWFGLYTAVKASYISSTFAIRVEERNLIYLSPIVFVAAVRFVADRRVRPLPLVLAAGATAWLLWSTPYHAYEHLYSDAFGLSILQWLNQNWFWTIADLRWLLYGILALSVLFALCFATPPARRVHWRSRRCGRTGRRRLEPDGRDLGRAPGSCAGEVSALADPDASRLDRPGERPRQVALHREGAAELAEFLEHRVLEPVDRAGLVGRRLDAASWADGHARFQRHRRRDEAATSRGLGRRAARGRDSRRRLEKAGGFVLYRVRTRSG